MHTKVPTALLALSMLIAVSSCAVTPSEIRREQAVIEILRQRVNDWDRAIVAKDIDRIAANMAEDFRQIDRRGAVHDKEGFLRGILDRRLRIEPYSVEDLNFRIHGDTALVMGRTRMHGYFDGEPFTTHYRFVDVYMLDGGEWKVVNVQLTGLNETGSR